MKTIDTISALIAAEGRESYRRMTGDIHAAVEALEGIYRETIDMTPAVTIDKYVAAVGYDMALCVIATIVNRCAGDGRISRSCADWAAAQESAWDADAAERIWIGSDVIHRAHLSQLCAAMMTYTPADKAVGEGAADAARSMGGKIYRVSSYTKGSAVVTTVGETASLAEALELIHQQPTTDTKRHWRLDYVANGKTAFSCSPVPGSDRPLCPTGRDIEDTPTAMLADLIAVQTSYINGHADCDDRVVASRLDCIRQLGQRCPSCRC